MKNHHPHKFVFKGGSTLRIPWEYKGPDQQLAKTKDGV